MAKNKPPDKIQMPEFSAVKAEYIELDVRERSDGLLIKTATWQQLFAGNCVEVAGATLTLRSDGSATWLCVTFTNETHSGDYWWAGFLIQDKDGYRWGFNFNFDPGIFNAITQVYYSFKC
jgi:hypothetical protein